MKKHLLFTSSCCARIAMAHKQDNVDQSIYQYLTEYCNTLKQNDQLNLTPGPEELTYFLLYAMEQVKTIRNYAEFHRNQYEYILDYVDQHIKSTIQLYKPEDDEVHIQLLADIYWNATACVLLRIMTLIYKEQLPVFKHKSLIRPHMLTMMRALQQPPQNVLQITECIIYNANEDNKHLVTFQLLDNIVSQEATRICTNNKHPLWKNLGENLQLQPKIEFNPMGINFNLMVKLPIKVHSLTRQQLYKMIIYQELKKKTQIVNVTYVNNFYNSVGQVVNSIEQQTLNNKPHEQ